MKLTMVHQQKMFIIAILWAAKICIADAKRLRGATIFNRANIKQTDSRSLASININLSSTFNDKAPQYVQTQNSMLSVINLSKAQSKNEIDIYNLPSNSPYTSDEILGRLEGLGEETKFHTDDGFYLSMTVIDPHYDGLGIEAFEVTSKISSNKISNPAASSYKANPIPEGQIRGLMGLLGVSDNLAVEYLKMDGTIDNTVQDVYETSNGKKTIASYKVSAFSALDMITPSAKINPEALKPLPPRGDTPLGRLEGLLSPTRFHNDDIYISMSHKEPNVATIYTSTYMPYLNKISEHSMARKAGQARTYTTARNPNRQFLGLMGLFGESSPLEELSSVATADDSSQLVTYSSTSTFDIMLNKIVQPARVHNQAYKLPSHYSPGAPDIIGRLHGRLPDDGHNTYAETVLRNGQRSDKKLPNMSSGSSTGSKSVGIAFFNTLDKISVSRSNGVPTLVKQNNQAIDADIEYHLFTDVPSPRPSSSPTNVPSLFPSAAPTAVPSIGPTNYPTVSSMPTTSPTTTAAPTIKAFELANVALYKPTSQSATCHGGSSSRAVDGNTDGLWWKGSVTHTCYNYQDWWQVDLGASYKIDSIDVFNRVDCCSSRLNGFKVTILNVDDMELWSTTYSGDTSGETKIAVNEEVYGRKVKISLPNHNPLSLAEVKVNGFTPIVKSSGDAVHVACGSSAGSCYSKVHEKSTIEETHNVRCCSDSYKPGWTQQGGCNVWSESEINGMCVADVTFSTASLVCESVGGRLCTLEEVLGDCTRSSGCGFDQDLTWTSTTVDKSPEEKKVAAVCGASYGTCSVREQEASMEDLHEVRCCSDSYKPGWLQNVGCGVWAESDISGNRCIHSATYDSARAICESEGARLCTKDEILADCAAGSGCGFDSQVVWTSTSV